MIKTNGTKKLAALLLAGVMMLGFSACGESGQTGFSTDSSITVVSRESGSGTRGAFIELTGVEVKDASGTKKDMTTAEAVTVTSTGVVLTTVSENNLAIGYISLGSLNETVKALKVDGIEATAANIKNGTYKLSRPFNIVTKDGLSEEAQDFISFIMSKEGQDIVEKNGYIAIDEAAQAFTGGNVSGKIVVAGSSSVTPVMEKLKEAYNAINANLEIEIQMSDSSTGVSLAISGVADIGMASRELKDTETAQGVIGTKIALDGIAMIVNKANTFDGITLDSIKKIFTGEITLWSEVK